MKNCRRRPYFYRAESGGMVVVHGPTAVRDNVLKGSLRFDIVLCENVFPDITTAFPFRR